MADKKESALGAVTDFAQARVLDASGASKNIDKATMASVLAGEGTNGYWKRLEKEQSYNFIIERFSSVIIIGHQFYGMGLYAIPQNSAEPIFIGGIDVRQVNGVSISIDSNTGKATIKNGNIISVYYRFL